MMARRQWALSPPSDALTLALLAVLDQRLAREGRGVFLIVGSVEMQAP
jgi:hypothetical protein